MGICWHPFCKQLGVRNVSREAELHNQATRLKSAGDQTLREGMEKGIKEAIRENAKNFLMIGLDIEISSNR